MARKQNRTPEQRCATPKNKTRKCGPQTPEGKARAKANLKPPWSKGESGNPKGRPSAGASVIDWINQMQDYTRAQLAEVSQDDSAPAKKVIAAHTLLRACEPGFTPKGTPLGGPDFDRIVDRTEGRPKQSMDVTSAGQPLKAFVDIRTEDV